MENPDKVREDFDRIARISGEEWNHNNHYHEFLLRFVPPGCKHALDIGSGTGSFARKLSRRAAHVLGIDLAPEMVRVAREKSQGYGQIDYEVRDVMAWNAPQDYFDCISTIATLHHMPLEAALEKAKRMLAPGGVLLVLDLFQEGPVEMVFSSIGVPVTVLYRLFKNGRIRQSPEARAAWAEHAKLDEGKYLHLAEVRRICARVLPGARVRRHLFWRYSIVWKKA